MDFFWKRLSDNIYNYDTKQRVTSKYVVYYPKDMARNHNLLPLFVVVDDKFVFVRWFIAKIRCPFIISSLKMRSKKNIKYKSLFLLFLVNDKSNFYCFKLFSLFLFILRYFVTKWTYKINKWTFLAGGKCFLITFFLYLLDFDIYKMHC